MSMYPWHGTPNHPHPHSHSHQPHTNTGLQQTATPSTSTSSTAQYQMPHLRWLPSMMSRSQQQQQQQQQQQHHHHHHQQQQQQQQQNPTSTLPTISSNLRMAQNSNHQPVSVVVEPRPPPQAAATATAAGEESVEEASEGESDHSDSGVGTSRDMVVLDAPGDPEYAQSPEMGNEMSNNVGMVNGSGRRRGGAAGAGGLAITANGDRDDDLDSSLNAGNHNSSDARKHGKRLTTKEEVSLFDICNHHADEFGQRSNLCKWWITVTAEFTRDQGHPYSWHSVRRKVEMVTKQRMKFLEEQRDKGANAGEDLSNPRWRAAVDAWIPTWQRWEEAEAKRIEKRDSRKTRKRKSRAWDYPSWETASVSVPASDGWRAPSSPVVDTTAGYQHTTTPAPPSIPAVTAPAAANSVPVRLPPGFDSMFSNPNPSQTPESQKTTAYSYQQPTPPPPAAAEPPPMPPAATVTPAATTPTTEGNMMTALLQTLGRLNKHLDAANPNPDPPRSSPFISALVSTGSQHSQNPQHQRLEDNTITPTSLSLLKEELRREMQDELRREIEKDRASMEEKLDSVQRTQEMILEMLRQEPA